MTHPTDYRLPTTGYRQWASKETLDAHSKSAHLQALGPKIKDKTEGAPAMVFYQLVK